MIKSLFRKIQYELAVFIVLYIQFLYMMPHPQQMNNWCVTSFFFSYDYGFNSRFLIGSLLKPLYPFLSVNTLYMVIYASLVLLMLVVSIAAGRAIRSVKDNQKAVMILVALYLASPASIAHLYGWRNYGRFDMYLIMLTIACLYLVNTKANFLLPVLCFVAMAIHQVFAFSYFSIILFALLYHIYEKKCSKRSVTIAAATLLTALGAFLYFQFLTPGPDFNNQFAMAQALQKRTNLPISDRMIYFEYFASLRDHIGGLVFANIQTRLIKFAIVLILMLPLSLLIIYIFRQAVALSEDKKVKFLLNAGIFLPILMLLPAFVLTTDYGRWLTAIYTFHFAAIFYLNYKGCAPIVQALGKVQALFERNLHLVLMLVLYLSILGKFEDDYILDFAEKLVIIAQYTFG